MHVYINIIPPHTCIYVYMQIHNSEFNMQIMRTYACTYMYSPATCTCIYMCTCTCRYKRVHCTLLFPYMWLQVHNLSCINATSSHYIPYIAMNGCTCRVDAKEHKHMYCTCVHVHVYITHVYTCTCTCNCFQGFVVLCL